MRRCSPVKFGDVWSSFVDNNPSVAYKLAIGSIPDLWHELLGEGITSMTTSLEFKNGVLTAVISSPVARHEVFLRRNSLRDALNRSLGSNIIHVVIVR